MIDFGAPANQPPQPGWQVVRSSAADLRRRSRSRHGQAAGRGSARTRLRRMSPRRRSSRLQSSRSQNCQSLRTGHSAITVRPPAATSAASRPHGLAVHRVEHRRHLGGDSVRQRLDAPQRMVCRNAFPRRHDREHRGLLSSAPSLLRPNPAPPSRSGTRVLSSLPAFEGSCAHDARTCSKQLPQGGRMVSSRPRCQ